MLRIRVTCPPESTGAVVDELTGHDGVADVVSLPGAGVHPRGDVVEADVAREATDDILDQLEKLRLGTSATVTLSHLDTALGQPFDEANANAPGSGQDAVVWDQLAQETGGGSVASASFLIFLVIATLIAAVGLLTNSQVLIVGAMILGPEFTALAGIAVGLVRHRWQDCVDPARAVVIGFLLAIAATAGAVELADLLGLVPEAYLRGQRPLTSFVSTPNVFSIVVALLAGVAGTVSLTAEKSTTLVGVFVSVTTVPAAAEIGGALVTGQTGRASGAAIQLAANLVSILVAAVITLRLQRGIWHRVAADPKRRRAAGRRRRAVRNRRHAGW